MALRILALSILALGILALGILALGTLALSILALGTLALGILALGTLALGIISRRPFLYIYIRLKIAWPIMAAMMVPRESFRRKITKKQWISLRLSNVRSRFDLI